MGSVAQFFFGTGFSTGDSYLSASKNASLLNGKGSFGEWRSTLSKTNMEPENVPLEDEIHLQSINFGRLC